jgi:hypothetical protein
MIKAIRQGRQDAKKKHEPAVHYWLRKAILKYAPTFIQFLAFFAPWRFNSAL